MLPTREDAERLAEAIRGQGLLEVLKALQNFELKVEDIASLDTDVAMVIATSTMFIAGELATKLESPSNKVLPSARFLISIGRWGTIWLPWRIDTLISVAFSRPATLSAVWSVRLAA